MSFYHIIQIGLYHSLENALFERKGDIWFDLTDSDTMIGCPRQNRYVRYAINLLAQFSQNN